MLIRSVLCSLLASFCLCCWSAPVAVIDLSYKNTNGVFVQTSKENASNPRLFDYVKGLFSPDRRDHGNSMGVVINSVNPNAEVMKIKMSNSMNGLIDAVEFLTELPAEMRPHIVNMSIVSTMPCTTRLQQKIDAGMKEGMVFVAAMGNDGLDQALTPASCKGVVAVGSYRHGTTIPADFSNRSQKGIYVDMDQTNVLPHWSHSYVGTSYSAAVVSGVLSLDAPSNAWLASEHAASRIQQYFQGEVEKSKKMATKSRRELSK